jgi:hypothetical protein
MKEEKRPLSGAAAYCRPEYLLLEVEPTNVVCASNIQDGTTEPIEDKPWNW